MWVLIEVVPGDSTRMPDRQEFVGEGVMPNENRIADGSRQAANGALDPDDAIHSEGKMWRASVGCDTGKVGVPATHVSIVVVMETGAAEGELVLATLRGGEREGQWVG